MRATSKGIVPVWLMSTLAGAGLMAVAWGGKNIIDLGKTTTNHEERISAVEKAVDVFTKDHDLLIKIAEKLNVDTKDIANK